MSHLHIPDGVLPPLLWAFGMLAALGWLGVSARRQRDPHPRQVAFQGALGALVVAAMAIQIPLGPLEYHLTLVGPVGVLLGAAAGFQVVFVASVVLAFVGHGGFTVIGLNALVLGVGVACARPVYRGIRSRLSPAVSMALATMAGQAVSGMLWLLVLLVGLRAVGGADAFHAGRAGLAATIAVPLWLIGVAVESIVAFGLAGFLARVRPDLMPGPRFDRTVAKAA